MGKRNELTPEQEKLLEAIDEIMWQHWDPINMKGNDGPRDEYENYLFPILTLKINQKAATEIAGQLSEFEAGMGYQSDGVGCMAVAEKIVALPYKIS